MNHRQQPKPQAARRRGVTLIEIAIVLVIVGILLGALLKGQELINNARVRTLANDQTSLRAAWHAFHVKYGAMPGDYVHATQYIRGALPASPADQRAPGDGVITAAEMPTVFQNLASAGYIRCQQCTGIGTPGVKNMPLNSYGGIMAAYHDNVILILGGSPFEGDVNFASRGDEAPEPRLLSFSGARIPSNIAAEVDRKIDDGIANTGEIVFSALPLIGIATSSPPLDCMSTATDMQNAPAELHSGNLLRWRHSSVNPLGNCGFAYSL